MSDYAEILSQSWDDIPEPKLTPEGSWLLRGRNASFKPAEEAGKNDRVLFFYTPKEPMDDVRDEDIEALGDYEVSSNQIVYTIWIEGKRDWDKVRKHLEKHGIETSGRTLEESLKAFKGSEVVAYVSRRTFTTAAGETGEQDTVSSFTAAE